MSRDVAIDRILDAYKKDASKRISMSRGIVMLDENVLALETALQASNLRVLKPRPGEPDEHIKERLAKNIIITKNAKDFVGDASMYEYGIISLDKLKFIDPEPSPKKNKTVTLINAALKDFKLWSKGHGFIVVLNPNGRHRYQDLLD
jgi:hypothetical protein